MNYKDLIKKYESKTELQLSKEAIKSGRAIIDELNKINGLVNAQGKSFDVLFMMKLLTEYIITIDKNVDTKEFKIYSMLQKEFNFKGASFEELKKSAKNTSSVLADAIHKVIEQINEMMKITGKSILEYLVILSIYNGKIAEEQFKTIKSFLEENKDDKSKKVTSKNVGIKPDQKQELKIKAMGGTTISDEDSYYFSLGVEIVNPNLNFAGVSTIIKVIIFDKDKRVLKSDTTTIDFIDPNSTFYFGEEYSIDKGEPDDYQVLVQTRNFEELNKKIMDGIVASNFESTKDRWGKSELSGNITNNYSKTISSASLYFVLKDKDGKIKGGGNTQVHNLFPGQTDGFECDFHLNLSKIEKTFYSVDFYVKNLL
jgi:hypothetical protein